MNGADIAPTPADGLDLADPDDRATYRVIVGRRFANCRVTALARYAVEAGGQPPRDNSRAAAVAALANAWISGPHRAQTQKEHHHGN